MWNADTARRLANWYRTPEGSFALSREYRLFQRLVSDWPRRGHSLLGVGCGPGVFLEMLWEYGFDVTGMDSSQDGIDMARDLLNHRADFRIGQPDYLPFEDESMDYVGIVSVLEYVADPKAVLAEALRVASRGVIIGFMNRWSLYGLLAGPPWTWAKNWPRRSGRWFNPWSMARMVRELSPGARVCMRSVLPGPPISWRYTRIAGKINALELPLPLGAFVGLRVDKADAMPLTALPLTVNERQKKGQEACAACSTSI